MLLVTHGSLPTRKHTVIAYRSQDLTMDGNAPVVSNAIVRETDNRRDASVDLLSIVRGVLCHWRLIAGVLTIALLATYSIIRVVPQTYKSTAQILVNDPQRQMDSSIQKPISPFVDSVTLEALSTEMEVIKSRSI